MSKINPGNLTGVSGAHFVAAELSRRGYIALVTVKNTKGIDLIVSNQSFSKMVGIQVKTNYGKKKEWVLNKTDEEFKGQNLFYVFVNLKGVGQLPEYYIVKSRIVSNFIKTSHKKWLATPGKNGQPHNDSSLRKYKYKSQKHLGDWDVLQL